LTHENRREEGLSFILFRGKKEKRSSTRKKERGAPFLLQKEEGSPSSVKENKVGIINYGRAKEDGFVFSLKVRKVVEERGASLRFQERRITCGGGRGPKWNSLHRGSKTAAKKRSVPPGKGRRKGPGPLLEESIQWEKGKEIVRREKGTTKKTSSRGESHPGSKAIDDHRRAQF